MSDKAKTKFEDKYPKLTDIAIIAAGVVLGGIVLMVGSHYAKPLMASVMGTKTVATTTTASAATAAPAEVTGVTVG